MKVQDVMTQPAGICRPEDALTEPARLMWENDWGAVAVVDDDKVAGMITDRDICMAAYTRGQRLDEITVTQVMNGNVCTVAPDDSLQRAEEIMRANKVRRVPVIDAQSHAIGMLSLNDLALEALRELTQGQKDLNSNEMVETIGAICEHRPEASRAMAG